MKKYELDELNKISNEMRKDVIKMAYKGCSSHVGSSLSIIDILTVLYFKFLNINILNFETKNRDKFILSKGHASSALYSILVKRGFIKKEILDTYYTNGCALSGHPKRNSIPGIEASTGSLGHGLAIACGLSLSDKTDNRGNKTVVLMGDGECNEGSVWESAMFASARKLNNLIAIVDNNKLQGLGRAENIVGSYRLVEKWQAFNWNVIEIDGHDYDEIYVALKNAYNEKDRPTVIIAHTIKGKGVSFMEDKLEWHYKSPNEEEYKSAIKELM
ncbi:transketolase [Clostridium sporogenes]|uniref:Transketolase n=1 Tax=Clostridium sporogenes TaxID=1509 RepID=A0A7X5SWI1_CLOSG|nr:transketolase [Clostridium sporogenes]AJD31865.1 hypothetical protein T258_1470 [Clostridium botulinum Prevot_594]NFQ15397.1 transketolase [Clostridium sporogenes]NFQ19428.1 transketolase [Clostridium sporogenes]NFQ27940.1 transketolase [Clostridium sporogenes]NFR60125.1 transketolase [Clostridium sporogenes]